ncbi:MAG: adenylate/guanylate cyclase domain-containing protein [Pseudomonadota bacterium]|nr:adenylate/guanylate cyclase domain-containing protein [Pseudomonadota bacterium]
MSTPQVMVFIDLVGSTAAYEALGNAQAADIITKITQWAGRVVQAHGGRVIKYLGDGVLAQFSQSRQAVEAVIFLQQNHTERLPKWPEPLRMGMKIGMACGAVVSVGEDTFGDAVNIASRLSDMAGANAIWASENVIAELRQQQPPDATPGQGAKAESVRYRALGLLRVRGLAQPHSVFQVEWSEDVNTDLMTVRGALPVMDAPSSGHMFGAIALSWLGQSKVFASADLPLIIGRVPDCDFIVSDQRVSRQHARIEWADGSFIVTDTSSFGTWVRFADKLTSAVQLRRTHCILHATGELTLGAPFTDFSAPAIAFHIQ